VTTQTAGAVTSRRSRTTHVAAVDDLQAARGTRQRALCGRQVEVRRYPVSPGHDVCLACRKAAGWGAA
jgi:hypothetical protein